MSRTHATTQTPFVRFARPALAIVVVVQALGLILWTIKEGTPVGTWLFLDHLWPEAATSQFEWAGTIVACLGSLAVVFARRPIVRYVMAGLASGWCVAFALAEWKMGGAPFTELSLGAHAARIAAPLLLALWDRKDAVAWVLRLSVASTFAIHGFESIQLHPQFVDLILAADRNLFGLGFTQAAAEMILRVIGAHDIGLALLVLVGRYNRHVLVWMAFWGVVTAFSRIVQGGEGAIHSTVIRVANGGLPLVLLLLTPGIYMPRNFAGPGARLARAALPVLLVALPMVANAQAVARGGVGHLRVVWTEDPAHRATISWSTVDAGSTHEVHVDTESRGGVIGSYANTFVARSNGRYTTGGGYYHHADVTGLKPSTTYHFVVVTDGKASAERHFVTAPADDRAFRLLSGADSRAPGEADRRVMNELMATMLEADPSIIALAHGGDFIESSGAWGEWESWMTDHDRTTTAAGRVLPIIPVRGNHEGNGVMYNEVFGFPGGTKLDYFATQLSPNVVLLNLDTNSSIGGDQAIWLEEQLHKAQSGRWILASYHRPAFPAVKTPSGARQFWVPLFEQYNADVVLESDGHVLKRTLPIRNGKHDSTGVVYVGEGGLGVPQRKPDKHWYLAAPGMAKSAHHVQLFSFSPTRLVYEAGRKDGTVVDSYTFRPRRAGLELAPTDPGADPGTSPGSDPWPGENPQTPGDWADATSESGGCSTAGGSVALTGLAAVAIGTLRRRRGPLL